MDHWQGEHFESPFNMLMLGMLPNSSDHWHTSSPYLLDVQGGSCIGAQGALIQGRPKVGTSSEPQRVHRHDCSRALQAAE